MKYFYGHLWARGVSIVRAIVGGMCSMQDFHCAGVMGYYLPQRSVVYSFYS